MVNLCDSYSETNQSSDARIDSDETEFVGQSFTGNGETLDSVKVQLKYLSQAAGNFVVRIYAHSGTYGTSSVPTGSALATSDTFDQSSLTTSYQLITFDFTDTDRITLSDGTKYVLMVETINGGSYKAGKDDTSPTHGGNFIRRYYDDYYYDASEDLCFYVYTEATGLNMKVNIGDAWKDVAAVKINIGDSWKEVTAIKQNIGDSWKTV